MTGRTVIIDVQGFQLDQQFIPKELFAIDLNTGLGMSHHVFKEPFPHAELSEKHQDTVQWLSERYHGLSWTGIGRTHFCDLQDVMWEVTINASRILCKGALKKRFIEKYVNCEVVDLETTVPSLRRLNNKATCNNHNFENSHCAVTNVFYLYNYLRFIQI